MHLSSKDTTFYPANAQIGQKMTSLGPTWAQIISVCEFRLLQKYFNVIIDSSEMFIKPIMLFTHTFVIQIHHYLPNRRLKLAVLGQKMSSCVAIMVKIPYGHGFSFLQNLIKVQIDSLARFTQSGRRIPHVFVIQRHYFLPSQRANSAKNDQFGAYLDPNNQCV